MAKAKNQDKLLDRLSRNTFHAPLLIAFVVLAIIFGVVVVAISSASGNPYNCQSHPESCWVYP